MSARVDDWVADGFTEAMRTPDSTLIFVTPEKSREIRTTSQAAWAASAPASSRTGRKTSRARPARTADPRSLLHPEDAAGDRHGGDIEDKLMFAGHNAYRFADDPFYANGFVPTVKQLVERDPDRRLKHGGDCITTGRAPQFAAPECERPRRDCRAGMDALY